jgi:chitinase
MQFWYKKFCDTADRAKEKLIGYYTSMSAYSGYTPDKIDATKFTNINYAFANIGEDLKISIGDPVVDESNFKLLKERK